MYCGQSLPFGTGISTLLQWPALVCTSLYQSGSHVSSLLWKLLPSTKELASRSTEVKCSFCAGVTWQVCKSKKSQRSSTSCNSDSSGTMCSRAANLVFSSLRAFRTARLRRAASRSLNKISSRPGTTIFRVIWCSAQQYIAHICLK